MGAGALQYMEVRVRGRIQLKQDAREAQSGRRFLGKNGGSLWLWCCLAQAQRTLVDYSPWGRKELDTTERLHFRLYGRNLGPKPHPHDSTLGESSREAPSGRRLLGKNGGSLWLWCCLPQPGALGP